MNHRYRPFVAPLLSLIWAVYILLGPPSAIAAPRENAPVPVWLYHADSFEFWQDENGQYQGYYPELIRALNQQLNLQLEIRPIDGNEISRRFKANDYGVYAGVIRTEERARTRLLSARLFDNEVVAASLSTPAVTPEELAQTRVIFRRNDATRERVEQRYPDLHFRERVLVDSSEEAFRLLSQNKADFYINDASEMENTERYYMISRPFPALRIASVLAFSPELREMRAAVNDFIGQHQHSGWLQKMERQSKRNYLLSRITLNDAEKTWIASHTLDIWLPKNENFAPLIWRDAQGYHGSAINMINDMRDLLHINVQVHYVDNYVAHLQQENWPVRLVNLYNTDTPHAGDGIIGPQTAWHNVYYNRIGQPFIWDEDQVRNQRIGVIRGSFGEHYLQQRFGNDVIVVSAGSLEELLDASENHRIDFILGDLSSLELSLRGNELFRGVLKVAGMTRSEYRIGPWVDSQHPIHHLLAQTNRLSSFRSQLERHNEPPQLPELTKNTLKIISLVLLITALFSLFLLLIMWRQMRQNRAVNRNIVEALEKVNRAHDDETGSHIKRVARYSGLLARTLKLPRKTAREIEAFASLHDVGKIAVPDRILRKEGPLTEEEFNEMKLHTVKGWRIIQGLELGSIAENIIHYHHEKWDGSGYPEGMRGEQIPIEARILAVADVYDALRQKRVYKPGYAHEYACQLIFDGEGRHFDPHLVALFRQHHQQFAAIYDSLAD